MPSPRGKEHFATLFDSKFLPIGMALHRSLQAHAAPFHLWILCMDEMVERQLAELALPNVTLIPLRAVETEALKRARPTRSTAEYCWTVTPFLPQFVFDLEPGVPRVTYVDSDLFFFDNPMVLLDELSRTGKHVLITEHAYAPNYDKSSRYGRFCVQFNTFLNTPQARNVLRWWQERCLEWCYSRLENGKFGDQKYLDIWPELFGDLVHVCSQKTKTLAPWNVRYLERRGAGSIRPVFFHFHELRIRDPNTVQLYRGYRIGAAGMRYYRAYMEALRDVCQVLRAHGIPVPVIPSAEHWPMLRRLKREIFRQVQFESIFPQTPPISATGKPVPPPGSQMRRAPRETDLAHAEVPALSVVTVVLNDLEGLKRTYESLLSQSHRGWEWIVCDGGSGDQTRAFLGSLRSGVRWVSKRDNGVYDGMNHGVSMCSGVYVVFMNAGDTFFDDATLAKVFAGIAAAADQPPDILFGGVLLHFQNGREVYRSPRRVEDYLWHGLPANHQATFYRRTMLGAQPYDLQYGICGDYYLAARFSREGARAVYLDVPLAKFEVGGLSYKNRRQLFAEPYRIQRDVLGLPLSSRLASVAKRLISVAGVVVLSQPFIGTRKR